MGDPAATGNKSNQVRIIGGRYRGRKLPVPDLPGLRPTGDRVRETLFNWLAPVIAGAHCLDLFAGTGALGMEAVSRGAGRVVMMDRSAKVVRQLQANLALLRMEHVALVQADALEWLESQPPKAFDIVFLDPPFDRGLLLPSCERLMAGGWLRSGARVYLEVDKRHGLPPLPDSWRLLKQQQAGQVVFCLARCG